MEGRGCVFYWTTSCAPGIMCLMSNAELGRRIGVTHSMASRIRNGKRLPGSRTLHAIHQELGIPLADLHAAHDKGSGEFGRLMREHMREAA